MVREAIADFTDHVRFYLEPENHRHVEFLMTNSAQDATAAFLDRFDGRAASLRDSVQNLSSLGYEPLAVDRTGEDLESIGMFAVHVVVPGLHPLHVGTGLEHRDPRRLEKLCAYNGVPRPTKLNLEPHPFP
jgi:ribosomal protein S12 methylthiotransferase accessory factor